MPWWKGKLKMDWYLCRTWDVRPHHWGYFKGNMRPIGYFEHYFQYDFFSGILEAAMQENI